MTTPCEQAPTIDKMDRKIDRVVELLAQLRGHQIEIQHLVEHQKDHQNWLKAHEMRIQALEKAPGATATRAMWLLYGGAVSTTTGIIVGVAVYFITR